MCRVVAVVTSGCSNTASSMRINERLCVDVRERVLHAERYCGVVQTEKPDETLTFIVAVVIVRLTAADK